MKNYFIGQLQEMQDADISKINWSVLFDVRKDFFIYIIINNYSFLYKIMLNVMCYVQ